MNYRFGNKAQWRRTVWNEIARRVPDRKNAVVLYLAGPENYDKAEAVRRGFDSRNLIAVERNISIATKLRKEGQLCVVGDFGEVLLNWPVQLPISVAFADVQHNCEWEKVQPYYLAYFFGTNVKGSVLVVNLLRGREQNTLDNMLNRDKVDQKVYDVMVRAGVIVPSKYLAGPEDIGKHRGMLFSGLVISNAGEDTAIAEGKPDLIQKYQDSLAIEILKWKPKYLSYKSSSGQTFDTAIYGPSMYNGKGFVCPLDSRLQRQIAAVLAHRTMRMND